MSFWWSSVYQWRIFPSAAAMEKYESVFWVTLLKSSVEQQCQSGALNTLNSLHFTAVLHETCSSWIQVTSDAAVAAWIIEKCIFQSKHTVIIQSDLLLAKTSRNSPAWSRFKCLFLPWKQNFHLEVRLVDIVSFTGWRGFQSCRSTLFLQFVNLQTWNNYTYCAGLLCKKKKLLISNLTCSAVVWNCINMHLWCFTWDELPSVRSRLDRITWTQRVGLILCLGWTSRSRWLTLMRLCWDVWRISVNNNYTNMISTIQ